MTGSAAKRRRKGCVFFSLVGFSFFFCMFSCRLLAEEGNIIWSDHLLLPLGSLLLGIATGCALCFGMYYSSSKERLSSKEWYSSLLRVKEVKLPGTGFCFWVSWILIFLSWLPGYLAYYPGICSYDITIQTGQIVDHSYNDHHPLAHTLLLEGAMKLGDRIFGDVNAGIAVYTLGQMLLLSFAFAFGIMVLRRLGAKWYWLLLILLYGMFFPFHMYMSVSVTKDTIFAAFLFVMLILLYSILNWQRDSLRPDIWDVGYVAAIIGMILFRNNGRYAFLVLLFFNALAVFLGRKHRKMFGRLLGDGILGLAVGSILISVLFSVTGAQQGDRREMLSIPIQQLARTMVYHGGAGVLPEDDNTISEADKALINEFIRNQAYKEYRGDIADPVKRNTNTSVVRYRSRDFVKTYVNLFLGYPGDYLNAVLAVNAGYLWPGDVSHAFVNVNGYEKGMGYVQTRWVEAELNPRGIYKDSKWPWLRERLEQFADSNAYLDIPVIKYLFVPGTYLWMYLLLAGYLLVNRKYRLLLPMAFVLGYYLTLLLGPTVQLRYIYPVMISLPFLFVWDITYGFPMEERNIADMEEK